MGTSSTEENNVDAAATLALLSVVKFDRMTQFQAFAVAFGILSVELGLTDEQLIFAARTAANAAREP